MTQIVKSKIDQACRVAEEFTKLYYETSDKRRHLMSRLYLDSGLLAWNGNGINGNERIQKFFIDLPTSDHTINTLDAQPILDSAVNGQLTFMIQVSGTVKYQDRVPKSFQQNFIITAQGDKWKIVSDCFRLQEPLSNNEKT
ncbi:NTF2-related export protein [Asbolus verrucosus]|uniref:NTF2-related export protein n=1 Tax=Asbolus verrucosus TaxID=1661398 RepID=A0A482VDR1_ASBVE|nr:NTF2-related export protein [Asbolus verrucosus]